MSTIRVAKRPRYSAIDRRAINDERLSFRARGVLAWLLDKPDDWRINRETLAAAAPEGSHAIRTALKELAEAGYLVRERVRDERGRIVTETVLYEFPPNGEQPPLVDFPPAGNRPAGGPPADNPPASRRLEPKTEPKPPAEPQGEGPRAEADAIAKAHWERRRAKPCGGKFIAFRQRIEEQLEAGRTREELDEMIPSMAVFTRDSFDYAAQLRERPPPSRNRQPETPPPNHAKWFGS